ncbi:glucans biosynthesis glucosyltransferase MdoH [Desulfovibrio sp. TomC]|uniref:glucans biosynthesis glucosyltransferase MdoH n=1 Tax=Desulfovibrio sp. TomC TaxID=1562888 RepID=UPI0005732C66|nr:glucans biosynthesis glucosyltransferase MdoH [Desulfovibrio sp. TomC]KHK01495.1 Glucans biosynthesis glucosyltransferase H [Desulfovibrio sp. TomC]
MSQDTATSSDARRAGGWLDGVGARVMAYLRRLPLPEPARLETALESLDRLPPDVGAPEATRLAMTDLMARLNTPRPDPDLRPTPPLCRTPMAPESMGLRVWRKAVAKAVGTPPPEEGHPPKSSTAPDTLPEQTWSTVAGRRRMVLAVLIFAPTAFAVLRMASVLPHEGGTALEKVLLVVFAMLFAWISVGFWTAMVGFCTLIRRFDRFAVTRPQASDAPARADVRTAIVFPVYGEDMDRVTAGIEAVYRSLARDAGIDRYDFFILSDTRDPEAWAEEEAAWAGLRDRLDGRDRIFYRRRRVNTKMKSGNIADFCRRFGANYVYMLVMDADSVMSGETIARMVAVMEARREVGILQSVPAIVGRETFLARLQQFASHLYGPMFSAGLSYWLLGDAQFWGHNALIRIKPFMRHCALPRLSGKPPLGGEISSHDFVETALMRRAGWSVWLAYDLPGSYEEAPPNLLAELARDRRWCKGNMQHLRLVFTRGFIPVHRALFLNGVMAYGSALLWFLFLAVSTAEAIIESLTPPTYFPPTRTLFPEWPIWEPWWALSLLATTGVLLFLPKIFAAFLVLVKGRRRLFGGFWRLAISMVIEVFVSSLLAPVRMLFHSKFVSITLLGRETGWGRQVRDDRSTPWSEAVRFHLGGTLLAGLWAGTLFLYNREFFWWVCPIFGPLLLAIPLSVATSLPGLGRWLKSLGLLLIPEEVDTPRELSEMAAFHEQNAKAPRPLSISREHGVALAVVDPTACCRRLGLLSRPSRAGRGDAAARQELVDKAVRFGPGGLTRAEKSALLEDPAALTAAHRAVWLLPEETLRQRWFAAWH